MVKLNDTTIVVTGAASGIGLAVAAACLDEGAHVTIVGRNRTSCDATETILRKRAKREILLRTEACDLSCVLEVEGLASRLTENGAVDALISNAGVQPWDRQVTSDGVELTFATNVLAHFVLVNGLTSALSMSRLKCVVATGSMVHRWGQVDWAALNNPEPFDPQKVYARSKAELLLLQTAFASRLIHSGIAVHTIEPGMTRTNFARHFRGFDKFMARIWQIFMRHPDDVARDFIDLLKRDDLSTISDRYWYKGSPRIPASFSTESASADRLMDYCDSLVTNLKR